MSGASIIVEDNAVRSALAELGQLGAGGKALKWVGVEVATQTRARIDAGGPDPDGNPWKPLNPAYAATKKGAGLLRELGMRGGLQGSITWRVTGDTVQVGSNKIYAAIHQFGGVITPKSAPALVFHLGARLVKVRKVRIPARPYLGLSAGDRGDLERLLISQIERCLGAARA